MVSLEGEPFGIYLRNILHYQVRYVQTEPYPFLMGSLMECETVS